MGRRVTYMARRKLVRATAETCEIRGGEYVLADRASISGSLKAWLPLAMDGDALAQNYVGELSERGENGVPDYAMARLWYQRAAEQDWTPAQFNYARLLEQGLGGPADADAAAALYRAAYGLTDDLAGSVRLVDPEEILALRAELALRDDEIAALQAEVRDLEAQTIALEAARRAAEAEIARLEQSLLEQRTSLSDTMGRQADEAAMLSTLQAELTSTQAALAQKEAALAEQARRLAEKGIALAAAIREAAAAGPAPSVAPQQIAGLEAELASARQQIAVLTADRDSAIAAQTASQASLQSMRDDLNSQLQAVADREARLITREVALASQDVAAADLGAEREAISADRAALQAAREQLAADQAAYARQAASLSAERDAVSRKSAELAALDAELAERRRDLETLASQAGVASSLQAALTSERMAFEAEKVAVATAEADLFRRIKAIESREAQFAASLGEIDRRMADISLKETQLKASEAALEKREAELEAREADIENIFATLQAGISRQRSLVPTAQPASFTPEVERAKVNIEFGRFHALLIGNQNYDDPDWPDLDTSHRDVTVVGRLLETKYDFETTVLKDATRVEIMGAIDKLRRDLGPTDNLLIYFAGHGQYFDEIKNGYWEPVDSIPFGTANSISVDTINDQLSLSKARKVLVVADSCYAGAFTRAPVAVVAESAEQRAKTEFLRRAASKKSRHVMAAGGLQPVADGLGGGHSLFASAFILALTESDSIAFGGDVFKRIKEIVTTTGYTQGWEQEPQYSEIFHTGHEGGDFIFVPATL